MRVRKLLELQSTIEERKVPVDMNGELNKHYSESKGKEFDILDMDLIHLVRSYSKCIGTLDVKKLKKRDIADNLDSILDRANDIRNLLDNE